MRSLCRSRPCPFLPASSTSYAPGLPPPVPLPRPHSSSPEGGSSNLAARRRSSIPDRTHSIGSTIRIMEAPSFICANQAGVISPSHSGRSLFFCVVYRRPDIFQQTRNEFIELDVVWHHDAARLLVSEKVLPMHRCNHIENLLCPWML